MFFAIEGLPDTGKTNTAKLVVAKLTKIGYSCIYNSLDDCTEGQNTLLSMARTLPFSDDRRDYRFWTARVHHDGYLSVLGKELELSKRNDIVLVDESPWPCLYAYAILTNREDLSKDEFWKTYKTAFTAPIDHFIFLDPGKIVLSDKLFEKQNFRKVHKRYLTLAEENNWTTVKGIKDDNKRADKCVNIILEILKPPPLEI